MSPNKTIRGVHRQTCTRTKKKEKKKLISAAICELKYYELRHQSENCNFIKPSSDFARYIVVTVNRAEVIVWKSEKKKKKEREGRRGGEGGEGRAFVDDN